ncbi:MAG: hypothetical protein LBP19_09380 [Treponema sp.]|nr:hypothetical protein [Treponema sp.]
MKRQKYNIFGETLTAREIIGRVIEEGAIELFNGIYLQTKEHLKFKNEENIKTSEDNLYYDPDNEDYIAEHNADLSENYDFSNYWITNEEDKCILAIKNIHNLKEYLNKNSNIIVMY